MVTIGIIGGMQTEIDLLLENMDISEEQQHAGLTFFSGTIGESRIVLVRCGVGKVNAAACTQLMIDKFSVDFIINTGIAGSLHHEVKICDTVISADVTHHDVRPVQMKNLFPFQETFKADQLLIQTASEAFSQLNLSNGCHLGRIISGESFVEDTETRERLIEDYSPLCVEMEGSAIAHVAHINTVPFVVIRSISDNADENSSFSYESFESMAARQSASIVLQMVHHLKDKAVMPLC